jgi:hypothetical protein
MFTLTFLHTLILIALIWTSMGTFTLLALLVWDWRRGKLW